MDLETVKKLIKKYIPGHENFISRVQTAERYYLNDNDILHMTHSDGEKPLRNADNRIPSNFHGLLVDQKAAYMFTSPPLFDVGNKSAKQYTRQSIHENMFKTCDKCVKCGFGLDSLLG